MAQTKKQRNDFGRPQPPAPPADVPIDIPIEIDPAVERGERIDTGKTIARGGKETGNVPGAQPSKKARGK